MKRLQGCGSREKGVESREKRDEKGERGEAEGHTAEGGEIRKIMFVNKNIKSDSIVFLGDSLTEWFDLDNYFNRTDLVNRGVSGDITDGVLYRLEEIINANPSAVYLMIGINDLFQGYAIEHIITNIKTIIDRILEGTKDTKLFIQSILPVNEDYFIIGDNLNPKITEINAQLESFCKYRKVKYINLYPNFLQEGKLNPGYTNDGGHLTDQGYEKWALLIQTHLS